MTTTMKERPSTKAAILRRTEGGFKPRAIADEFGITKEEVVAVLKQEVLDMKDRGNTEADIVGITGITLATVKRAIRARREAGMSELEIEARKMLDKVPETWNGSRESWRQCVRANFADVLK